MHRGWKKTELRVDTGVLEEGRRGRKGNREKNQRGREEEGKSVRKEIGVLKEGTSEGKEEGEKREEFKEEKEGEGGV